MQAPAPDSTHAIVILRGHFNPQIFQPAWLAAQGLIRPAESEDATISIIHPEVVAYTLDWAKVEVEREMLTVATTSKTHAPEQVRDLALGMLGVLNHTPIHGVGLRFSGHYPMSDQDECARLIEILVPQTPWAQMLENPSLNSLTMQGDRIDGETGRRGNSFVTVEPSRKVANAIFVAVLDQYEVADSNEPALGAQPARDALDAVWSTSPAGARSIVDSIFELYAASR